MLNVRDNAGPKLVWFPDPWTEEGESGDSGSEDLIGRYCSGWEVLPERSHPTGVPVVAYRPGSMRPALHTNAVEELVSVLRPERSLAEIFLHVNRWHETHEP